MSPCPSCPLHARSPCHSVCHAPSVPKDHATSLPCFLYAKGLCDSIHHAPSMPGLCTTLPKIFLMPEPHATTSTLPEPYAIYLPYSSMLGAPSTFSSHIHSLPEAYASLSTTFYLMPGPMPLSQPCSIPDKGPCHSVPQAESSVYFSLLHRGQTQRP